MALTIRRITCEEATQKPSEARRIKPSPATRAQSRVTTATQTEAAESFGAGDLPSLAGPWTPTQTNIGETAAQREARKAAILAERIWSEAYEKYHNARRYGYEPSWTARGRVERLWQNAHRLAITWAMTYQRH